MIEHEPTLDMFPLSDAGRARREAILHVLISAQRRRVRVRRAARSGAALVVVTLAAAAAYRGASLGPVSSPGTIAAGSARLDSTSPEVVSRVASIVHTDDAILARVSVQRTTLPVSIDDDQLLALLREAGRDDGIVRVHGRAMITSELAVESGGWEAPPGRL